MAMKTIAKLVMLWTADVDAAKAEMKADVDPAQAEMTADVVAPKAQREEMTPNGAERAAREEMTPDVVPPDLK